MGKIIYTLNKNELEEIEILNEKKVALENLIKCIDPNNDKLYEKLKNDYSATFKDFNKWWEKMRSQYSWEGGNWSVDFGTGDIILIK